MRFSLVSLENHRFPRLYAAASLKPGARAHGFICLPCFPRLYAAASLKLLEQAHTLQFQQRFPRLYAAASLKPGNHLQQCRVGLAFSAALCRGLIEAR